jgi:flagellar biosynthesis component FlhA
MTEYNDVNMHDMEQILASFVESAHEARVQESVLGAVRLLCKHVDKLEKQNEEQAIEIVRLNESVADLDVALNHTNRISPTQLSVQNETTSEKQIGENTETSGESKE